jgi:hypothetical protein
MDVAKTLGVRAIIGPPVLLPVENETDAPFCLLEHSWFRSHSVGASAFLTRWVSVPLWKEWHKRTGTILPTPPLPKTVANRTYYSMTLDSIIRYVFLTENDSSEQVLLLVLLLLPWQQQSYVW